MLFKTAQLKLRKIKKKGAVLSFAIGGEKYKEVTFLFLFIHCMSLDGWDLDGFFEDKFPDVNINDISPNVRGLSHSQSPCTEADPRTESDNWEGRH